MSQKWRTYAPSDNEDLPLLFSKADVVPGERRALANAHAGLEQELHQGQVALRMAGFCGLTRASHAPAEGRGSAVPLGLSV